MDTLRGRAATAALIAPLAVAGPARAAEEESVVQEVLGILKERGIVDQQEYERLALKNASYESQQKEGLLSGIQWFGDARVRVENFWYEEDALGVERDDRHRFRYRLRVGALAPIHHLVTAGFRLASGEDDLRSTNQSAGRDDPDFDPDSIFVDQAFVSVRAPGEWLGEGSSLALVGGKVENPLRWKATKDYLVWDPDINPEGGSLLFSTKPTEAWTLHANAGYFVVEENTSTRDPHLLGVQGGFTVTPVRKIELGARVAWYEWHSLDGDFLARGVDGTGGSTSSAGNLPGGLSDGSKFGAGELAAYLRWAGSAEWPVLLFVHWAHNFDAQATVLADEEDQGFGGGVEVGDKKSWVLLGTGYYRLEANFWPSQFIDSDLTDGITNRESWTLYAVRQIFPNTDVTLELFLSDELEDDSPTFDDSVSGAERYRLRTDVQVRF